MKHFAIALAFLLTPLFAFAGEKVDKALDFISGGYVDVSNVNGLVKVVPWDKNSVKISGELSDNTKKFTFERDGNRIHIKVEAKNLKNPFEKQSDTEGDNLLINLPAKSQLSYDTVNSEFIVDDLEGSLTASSVNGKMEVSKCQNKIKLNSINGEIIAQKLQGVIKIETVNGKIHLRDSKATELSLRTVNGEISANSSASEVKISAVSGNTQLQLGVVQEIDFSTVSGNADIGLELSENGNINATTVSGDLTLRFSKDPSAYFDIDNAVGGDIVNQLSDDAVQQERYSPGKHLQFAHNKGNGKVKITSVSGTITLTNK